MQKTTTVFKSPDPILPKDVSPPSEDVTGVIQSIFPDCLFGFLPDRSFKGGVFEKKTVTKKDLDSALLRNYGVFFTPNGHGDVKNPKGTLLRHDGNVIRLNACFADFDSGSKQHQRNILNAMPAPYSLLIESKRGFHAYWMLKPRMVAENASQPQSTPSMESPESLSLWRRIQSTIAEKYGADKACSNPSRLMRLPGSYHVKSEPFLVSISEHNNLVYTLAELEVAFPPPPRKEYQISPNQTRNKRLRMPEIVALSDGSRHNEMKAMAGRLYKFAPEKDAPAIRSILKCWYSSSCINLKPDWEKETDDVCEWIERREFGAF